ncbi:MAG: hypothetical protein QXH91_01485 [Candidatus Bathyarchaeia archaeon]
MKDYEKWNVIQRGAGKSGTHYIRVTNIRGKKAQNISSVSSFFSDYIDVITKYLKIGYRPQSLEIQRLVNLLVYELIKDGHRYSVADFDDGLMYVGTKYCFNHENPTCKNCPLKDICKGYNKDRSLIEDYTT